MTEFARFYAALYIVFLFYMNSMFMRKKQILWKYMEETLSLGKLQTRRKIYGVFSLDLFSCFLIYVDLLHTQ